MATATIIQHEKVDSDMFQSVGYDPQSQTLEVTFKDRTNKDGQVKLGETYSYQPVSPELYKAFRAADSHGKFYLAHIRNSIRCVKIGTDGEVLPPAPKAEAPKQPEAPAIDASTELALIPAVNVVALERLLKDIVNRAEIFADEFEDCFAPVRKRLNMADRLALLSFNVKTDEDCQKAQLIGKACATFRREADAFFAGIKKAVKAPHDAALVISNEVATFLSPVEAHLSKQVTEFRKAQNDAREAERKRIEDEQRQTIENKRIEDAIKAEEKGKTKLADALLNAPIVTKAVDNKILPQAATKVEAVKTTTTWKFEVTDVNEIPRDWMMVDMQKVGQFVRSQKAKAVGAIPGIKVWSEEGTQF